jgi:hypothetical protein
MLKVVWTASSIIVSVLFLADFSNAFSIPPHSHGSAAAAALASRRGATQHTNTFLRSRTRTKPATPTMIPLSTPKTTTASFSVSPTTTTTTTTTLWMGGMNNYDGSTDGTNVAPYLLAFSCAIAVWLFTIPVEFRRTKLCSEEETVQYPTLCTTPAKWSRGIQDYYANGGGVKFDFSVAKEGNPWVGGTFREEE